jgi:hypothetical protein
MFSEPRWRHNWTVLGPAGAARVELQRSPARRRALRRTVHELPAGTPVVISGSAPGAIRRCRRFAAKAGIELEREYLAFPSARTPAYLIEDGPASVKAFVKNILVAPPRVHLPAPAHAGLALLRRTPWRPIRLIAPGRVVVGKRT